MKNSENKNEYIPPQFYSVDGLFEIISALENTNDPVFAETFPGALLFATRKEKDVAIDEKLMQKLEMTAESTFKQGLLLKEHYNKIIERIKNLKVKYKISKNTLHDT
ncbi:MAG: hypothetical protein PHY40_00405 [Patescibacteria group bacterium]|nr:hypothetical protein [Patescibacteria group bacterium]